jgi:tagatose 1,6-diphosphate aldolase
VGKIKNAGGSAVKLLVYYNPDAGDLAAELEDVVRQVADDCHAHDLPVFVEPVCYSMDPNILKESAQFAAQRPAIVRETARRFSTLGVDVLKLEFPVEAAVDRDEASWQSACAAVSEVATVPWVLLSAGVDFPIFERQVKVACQNGASGFLAGRAIWKECVTMSPSERQHFLQTTAQQRLNSLNESTSAYGRPWTDFYEPMATADDWFINYS